MKNIFILALLFAAALSGHAQMKYVDSLKAVLAKTTIPIERFGLLVKIEKDNFINGNGNVDSLSCIQMHQIAQQLNNDSLLGISYNWIGDYFLFNKADNTMALEYLFKGIPLAVKVKDKRTISSLYLDIALAYFNLNNPQGAVKYIRIAGDNLPDSSSPLYDYMARQYQSAIANYYILQHQPDSALHFINELNETNLRLKSSVFESRALGLSAAAYDQLGNEGLAEIYYRKANVLADSTHFYNTKLFVKKKYTLFLLHNNKIAEAEQQSRQLLNLGRQTNNHNMQLAAAGFLRQVYENRRMADTAYYYSEMESSLQDSIFSQNNIDKIQALAFNEQLRSIDEAAKNEADAQRRKQNIQYVLLSLGIIIFIILFLLLSRSIITNTKVIEFLGIMTLLIVFEFFNLLLNPFLESITGHSPALMLFALVCIAALLIPIYHRLEDWITKKLVEKNKQIRLAAARRTIEQLENHQAG